jgi:hypothetical protein
MGFDGSSNLCRSRAKLRRSHHSRSSSKRMSVSKESSCRASEASVVLERASSPYGARIDRRRKEGRKKEEKEGRKEGIYGA